MATWESLQLEVRPHGEGTACSARDVEIILAPISDLASNAENWVINSERWIPEAVSQYRKKQKALKEEQKSEDSNRFGSVSVHFTSGGESHFLFLEEQVPTFEFHTELRKLLADSLEEVLGDDSADRASILLNLKRLPRSHQAVALHAVVFLAETVLWKAQSFSKKESKAAPKTKKAVSHRISVASALDPEALKRGAALAVELGRANNLVRTLADLPANHLAPSHYRQKIAKFARERGLKLEFFDQNRLAKMGAGAFLAVTRADQKSAAGIAKLSYAPQGRRLGSGARKKIALVGKGICFDTGGYNLKTGNSMLGMHGDMTGSALALAMCGYFARIKSDFEVTAYLALAENLISPTAYKPNEVVVACDGTSIEVVDTDAEGRMVLADTLALARKDKPSLVIDYATLTYAAIRSLDTRRSAVFSNDSKLASLAVECGDRSGERCWSFPLSEDYREELKSKVADILQCANSECADHIYAATFLSCFVGKETPWVHVDLGSCTNKGGLGLITSETTGFGVLWTARFVEEFLRNPASRV